MELWCRQMTYHLVPWKSMEHSMEFYGTLVPPNEISLSSMEFHGTLSLAFYDLLPWTSKEYSTEFHGTLESPNKKIIKKSPKIAISNDTCSMEFHVIFHGSLIPPNEISLSSMEFHGTLRLSFYSMSCYPGHPWDIPWISSIEWPNKKINELLGIPWNKKVTILNDTGVLWNSMELWSRQIKNLWVPCDSMELWWRHFKWHKCSMEFHGTFHGIPWNSGAA